ncbi:MAG: hypothetical protein ACLU38_12700 [Dysosmobacter sp.]
MNFAQSFRLALKSLMTSKMRASAHHAGHHHRRGRRHRYYQSLGNGMQQYDERASLKSWAPI